MVSQWKHKDEDSVKILLKWMKEASFYEDTPNI